MFSIKTAVATALTTSTALSTLVGTKIFFHYPPSFIDSNLPSVSYKEIDNTEGLHADDQEIGAEFLYQIDIWSKSSTTAIAKEIDTIMKSLDFNRLSAPDLYEPKERIHHKAMTYRLDYSDPNF